MTRLNTSLLELAEDVVPDDGAGTMVRSHAEDEGDNDADEDKRREFERADELDGADAAAEIVDRATKRKMPRGRSLRKPRQRQQLVHDRLQRVEVAACQ